MSSSRRGGAASSASAARDELKKLRELRELGLRRDELADSESDEDAFEEMDEEQYRAYRKKQREQGDFIVDDDVGGYGEDEEAEDEALAAAAARAAEAGKGESSKKQRLSKAAKADDGTNQKLSSLFGKLGSKASAAPSQAGVSSSVREREAQEALHDVGLEAQLQDLVAHSAAKGGASSSGAKRKSGEDSKKKKKKHKKQGGGGGLEEEELAYSTLDLDSRVREPATDTLMAEDGAEWVPQDSDEAPAAAPAAVKAEAAAEEAGPGAAASSLLAAARTRSVRAPPRKAEPAPSTPTAPPGVTFMSTPPVGARMQTIADLSDESGWAAPLTPTVGAGGSADAPAVGTPTLDGGASSSAGAGRCAPPQLALDEERRSEWADMYVLDMYEDYYKMRGTVFMFGKVWDAERKQFCSCSVQVKGVSRVLTVLPREAFRGSPEGLERVLGELRSKVVDRCLRQGEDGERVFKVRKVELKYAFELADVPRDATEYLELHYPMANEQQQCEPDAEGETFQRVFGGKQSAMEQLCLSRELKGPSWLRLRRPKWVPEAEKPSWSAYHCVLDAPRDVQSLTAALLEERQRARAALLAAGEPLPAEEALALPPPPPLRVLSLALKTVVNKAHENEVVLVSGLLRDGVDMVGATPGADRSSEVRVFSIVRPAAGTGATAWPPGFKDLAASVAKQVQLQGSERALLMCLLAKLQQLDPDVVVGHNARQFDVDVLLSRMHKCSVGQGWSRLGRLKLNDQPRRKGDGTFGAQQALTPGRLLLDTYVTAKELLLGQRSYSLTELCRTQLGKSRTEVQPQSVPALMQESKECLLKLIGLNEADAWLALQLAFRLEAVPLTHQLAALSGTIWSRTLAGGRADRIEYLLLHEFRKQGYLLPDKYGAQVDDGAPAKGGAAKSKKQQQQQQQQRQQPNNNNNNNNNNNKAAMSRAAARKPKYDGGLVLEPRKGLYDKFVILLDFNSLYPSIIQEFNICYTTVERQLGLKTGADAAAADAAAEEDALAMAEDGAEEAGGNAPVVDLEDGEALPALPDLALHREPAVLPSLIKMLVDRRRAVKKELKTERDPSKLQQLEVRQKALKITANSMYGCLGFRGFRFYAKPVAALVTSQGREILQSAVATARELGYDVIYGDTDSLFVNTNSGDLDEAKKVGERIKHEVNKKFRLLEIEQDGIFKSLLLLKKKKYAALSVAESRRADGSVQLHYEKETKGLDLVRRDWCGLSKRVGHAVLDHVLSGKSCDEVVELIHTFLDGVALEIKERRVPLEELVITKGLSKPAKDYPDARSQPHLQVALGLEAVGKRFNPGDHIPYVICTTTRKELLDLMTKNALAAAGGAASGAAAAAAATAEGGGAAGEAAAAGSGGDAALKQPKSNSSYAERAFHPDEVKQANGLLSIDWEWYLKQQVVPPTQRLVEPIEGTSAQQIALHLGLDPSQVAHMNNGEEGGEGGDRPLLNIAALSDADRFKQCERVKVGCPHCLLAFDLPAGPFFLPAAAAQAAPQRDMQRDLAQAEGVLQCPGCDRALEAAWVANKVRLAARTAVQKYYQGWSTADDPSVELRTRQQSVIGRSFSLQGRRLQLRPEYGPGELYSQLKYLETVLDLDRANEELAKANERTKHANDVRAPKPPPAPVRLALDRGKHDMRALVDQSAYNWVAPELFKLAFKL